MMTIDMTAALTPVMIGLVVVLAASVAGIATTIDRSELPRFDLRAALRRGLRQAASHARLKRAPAVANGF